MGTALSGVQVDDSHSSFSAEGQLVTLVYRGKINDLTLWQTVTEKGMINYCRVEWIKGGGYADWLPISIFQCILATTQDNLATKLKRIGTQP